MSPQSATAVRRRALLIGVSRFDESTRFPPLPTSIADVEELARVLRDPVRCRFDVQELHDPDAQRLSETVERLFATAGADDLVLFYFSGHGTLGDNLGLHLCATNTNSTLLLTTTLPLALLNQIINSRPVAQVVVILDCCFSGAAEFTMKGGGDELTGMVRNELGEGKGKYVITSSGAFKPSLVLAGDKHSLFSKWLIHGLQTGEPDADENGSITIDELYRYVHDRVTRESPAQEPAHYALAHPGNVVIGYTDRPGHAASRMTLASHNPDFFAAVQARIEEGKIMPFLGAGFFGSGPLSPFALFSALAAKARFLGQADLATVAEYHQQWLNDRDHFLGEFKSVLAEQSAEFESSPIHDLLLTIPRPPLIISATYDTLLERRLDARRVPYTLVAHILRSRDGEHDGKILVLRQHNTPAVTICRADAFVLSPDDELVIYKVLGSPFLTDYTDPGDELDTVVVTESDHLLFVSRLENEHTRVPDAFSLPFKRSSLLFLGYSLDLWHYRLVLRVFGSSRLEKSYAVRQPTSQMEALYWKRLGPDMIEGDPAQFAEQLLKVLTPAQVG